MVPKPLLQAPLLITNCPGEVLFVERYFQPTDGSCVHYRVEKYRPVFLDDIVGNTETIERLKIIAKDGNMPHVIISGLPGIGKTTSILCLARQLLGDAYKEAVLELNASDERGQTTSQSEFMDISCSSRNSGIDVVRNRIKGFAQKKVTLPPGRHKIVILDEADRQVTAPSLNAFLLIPKQYDFRCPTGPAAYDGNLLNHHSVRLCLQPVEQNY